jgi:hypothetical protein
MKRTILTLILALAGSAAIAGDKELEETARIMVSTSDECLSDVRDRKTSFAQSRSCQRLDGLATAYIYAGGGRGEEGKSQHMRLFNLARTTAWMALATSNGLYRNEPPQFRIW